MCRLAAFPPFFPRKRALDVLLNFAMGNEDGTGTAYVKEGQIIVQKYPIALVDVLKERKPLLEHMPHPGWTIAHLRAASHGDNKIVNTHPFLSMKKTWCVCHNGIWSEYAIVKTALDGFVKFAGQTDSEVASYLFAKLGPKKFYDALHTGHGGVFLGLHLSGELWAVKISGELEIAKTAYGVVLASDFRRVHSGSEYVPAGYLRLNAQGELIKQHKEYAYAATSYGTVYNGDAWREYYKAANKRFAPEVTPTTGAVFKPTPLDAVPPAAEDPAASKDEGPIPTIRGLRVLRPSEGYKHTHRNDIPEGV